MKKIIFKSPVDFHHEGKVYRFAPRVECEVSNAIASSSFIQSMAVSIVDVADTKDEPKTKPTTRRRRTVNADS